MRLQKKILLVAAVALIGVSLALPLRGALAMFAQGDMAKQTTTGQNVGFAPAHVGDTQNASVTLVDCADDKSADGEVSDASETDCDSQSGIETNDDATNGDTDNIQDPTQQDGEAPDGSGN